MNELQFLIRQEALHDAVIVQRLHERAFGPGRFARAAYLLREGSSIQPALSFVAMIGSLVIGSVRLTPIVIEGAQEPSKETPKEPLKACFLGPLTVDPAFEGRGIGRALMRKACDAAQTELYHAILLVGDESYYHQFGFERIAPYSLEMPAPINQQRFLCSKLNSSVVLPSKGRIRLHNQFDRLEQASDQENKPC